MSTVYALCHFAMIAILAPSMYGMNPHKNTHHKRHKHHKKHKQQQPAVHNDQNTTVVAILNPTAAPFIPGMGLEAKEISPATTGRSYSRATLSKIALSPHVQTVPEALHTIPWEILKPEFLPDTPACRQSTQSIKHRKARPVLNSSIKPPSPTVSCSKDAIRPTVSPVALAAIYNHIWPEMVEQKG